MAELKAAWGDLLGEYEWTHATTLTFRTPRTETAARREIQTHLRDLERRGQCRVPWFWVIEKTHEGHLHVHTLIDAPLSMDAVRESWQPRRRGWAKVQRYDPERGWRYYITKELGGSVVTYDISRRS